MQPTPSLAPTTGSTVRRRRTVATAVVTATLATSTVGLLWAPVAHASTITVCAAPTCDFADLQTAIDDAGTNDGDTITVDAGTFSGEITIDKELTVLGVSNGVDPDPSGRAQETTITGPYGVRIAADNVTLDGFEITNFRHGIAITGSWSNIHLSHNWIHGADETQTQEAGIVVEPELISELHIVNNIIETSATNNSLAAINLSSCCSATTPTIDDLQIVGNAIGTSGYGIFDGAAVASYSLTDVVINDNFFYGLGVTLNLGNILRGMVSGNLFDGGGDDGGTIGIDTGSITGNTFRNGARLGLWGSDAGFWRPSKDVEIAHNRFTDEWRGRGLTIMAGIDASTISVRANAFLDQGIAIGGDPEDPYQGYVVRNYGTNTLDATLNWWDHAGGAADHAGSLLGSIDTDPWIASYSDDTTRGGANGWPQTTLTLTEPIGFWPLVDTETSITGFTPEPSFTGDPLTTAGTVQITGLGGDTSGITSLHGRVGVTDATDTCTDTALTWSTTDLVFDFSCVLTATKSSPTAYTATYTDANGIPFYGDSDDTLSHALYMPEDLTISFNGEFFDADGVGTTTVNATIDGGTALCEAGVTVTFRLTPTVGSPIESTAVSGLDGTATAVVSLAVGVYDVLVTATDTDGCTYGDGVGTVVVYDRNAASTGGGWYRVDASPPRVNFGYTTQVKVNRRLGTTTVSGQVLWTHNGHQRLKGTIDGYYVPVDCPVLDSISFNRCAVLTGTGTLFDYDGDTGLWVSPRVVAFTIWVADGGTASMARKGGPKLTKPDAFGIAITEEDIEGESYPVQLNGGNLFVR